MSFGILIQNLMVIAIVVAAMIYTAARYLPALRRGAVTASVERFATAHRLPWLGLLAARFRPAKTESGCGSGCSSCGSCPTAAAMPPTAEGAQKKEEPLEFHPRVS